MTDISTASLTEYQGLDITLGLIKDMLNWIHDHLYYITHVYGWQEGQIDKDAFVGINFLLHVLQMSWKNTTPDNSTVLYPTRQLLSLFLLTEKSGDFEQRACISHVYWAHFFDKVHKDIAQGERSVFEISLRATGVPALVREI